MQALIITQSNLMVRRYPHRKATALFCLGVACAVTEDRESIEQTIDDLLEKALLNGVTQYQGKIYKIIFGSEKTKWVEWCGDKGKRYKTKLATSDWDNRKLEVLDSVLLSGTGVEYTPSEPQEEDLTALIRAGRLSL